MSTFRVLPIPADIAQAVRETRVSPFARHPTYAETAHAYGPCRLCLKTFEVGAESRILFTYDPFGGLEPFPLPGPVFIHESDCHPFPTDGGFPNP